MINGQSLEARNGGSYAASFAPRVNSMMTTNNNSKSTTAPHTINDGKINNPHLRTTTTVNTATTVYHQPAQHRDTFNTSSSYSPHSNVEINTQSSSPANPKSPRTYNRTSSAMNASLSPPNQTSSPYSSTSSIDLRAKLVAAYTVAMNSLESVTPDLLSKVGYDQAHTVIVEMHNEITKYNKSVLSKESAGLKPPNGPKDDFADAILRSGNLLSEYRTIFRKYESAVAAQGVASAQLKHTLASKQHIESEILHIKSRLQQIQFDWGKERGSFNL